MADFKSGPRAHLDEWVAPDIADELGFLRAGKILEWMDVVGVLAATRHCRRPVVTASVDAMELRHPIKIGERVTMTAEVAYTSPRSIGVCVAMTHGLPTAGTARESVAGYMTFVALDDAGKPGPVPQLHPETVEEIARFDEGRLRREFRNKLASGQLRGPPGGDGSAENPLLIREFLKLLPSFRLPWERTEKPRQRHLSYVHKIEPIRSSRLNFHGTLYRRHIDAVDRNERESVCTGVAPRRTGPAGGTARPELHPTGDPARVRAHPLRGRSRNAGIDDC